MRGKRKDDIGRTIRIESESQLESDPDTGRRTVITGPLRHTHAHTCTATQIYDLKSGYVGGPGLLRSHSHLGPMKSCMGATSRRRNIGVVI